MFEQKSIGMDNKSKRKPDQVGHENEIKKNGNVNEMFGWGEK